MSEKLEGLARIIHEHFYCPPVALQRATGTRDSLLRPACMGLPLHAGGRARRSVGQRTDHPLHVSEQRVPGTPPSLARRGRVPIALSIAMGATLGDSRVPIALLLQWVERDELS